MTTDATADAAAAASQGLTVEQWSEWLNSWSSMSPEDYFDQQVPDNWADVTPILLTRASATASNTESVHIKQASRTKTPGKNTILVDLGSNINIIGRNTTRDFVAAADTAGIPTSYVPRQNRLHVNRVGAGSATCDQEAIISIAVQFQDSTPTKESFKANSADGVGADLPAILGATSMREKDAVLILLAGQEFLAFPGACGYKIEWSPGTKLSPLAYAPSNHLVIPCEHFAGLPTGTATEPELSFWTDHSIQPGPRCELHMGARAQLSRVQQGQPTMHPIRHLHLSPKTQQMFMKLQTLYGLLFWRMCARQTFS